VRSFAYLDLVFQDTPFSDETLAKKMKDYIVALDSLPDTYEATMDKMVIRFERVDLYLQYLNDQEQTEFNIYNLSQLSNIFGKAIMPAIIEQYQKEKAFITGRIAKRYDIGGEGDLTSEESIDMVPEEIASKLEDIEMEDDPKLAL
jgi:hypothetical protein